MDKLVRQNKHRNSTVYLAKSTEKPASLLQKGNEDIDGGESIKHASVLEIRNVFENVASSKKTPDGSIETGEKQSHMPKNRVEDFKVMSELNAHVKNNTQYSPGGLKQKPHGPNYTLEYSPIDAPVSNSKEAHNYNILNPEVKSSANPKAVGQNDDRLTVADHLDSKSICPGSLLLQPASNVRGPLLKAEYLILNKFNDIKTFDRSKKRSKFSVDELDKRLEDRVPVTNMDDITFIDMEKTDELICMDFADEVIYDFEGAGIKVNRPVLKTSNLHLKKQKVSFSHQPVCVFEYPPEHTLIELLPDENHDLEFWTENVNSSESDQVPGKVTSVLQSSPACGGSGKLGSYHSRILEQYAMIPSYGLESTQSSAPQMQQLNSDGLQPTVSFMQGSLITSLSGNELSHPWSDGGITTDLLF